MNQTCLCGCNSELPPSTTGRPSKFLNDAHRKAFTRKNKIKDVSPTSNTTTETPTIPTEPPTNTPLIGSDGKDYSDPYKILPPSIAAYMPVQSHQNVNDLLSFEKVIHGKTPFQSSPNKRPPTF